MTIDVDYMKVADDAIKRIRNGAFLTVKAGRALNTMAIGWATFGYVWKHPVMMVTVRSIRHTFAIIDQAPDFTVTIPLTDMKKEIAYCGSKSGRDVDKFKACNLETAAAQKVSSPVIKTPGLYFECKIVYKSAMDPANLIAEYESLYPKKDFHTLYFGELQACYKTG
ncbi:MAG: flavin reductase [Desulfobacterales bacterium]|nr:flavin reductase [Desulfobacterales bacterium]